MNQTTKGKDLFWTLARHFVSIKFDNLPKETVETTKKSFLDTLGIIAAASGLTPECRLLVDLIKGDGGIGKSYSHQLDVSYGNPQNLIGKEDVIKKFQDCVSYSAKPLSADVTKRLTERVMKLEECEDVCSIFQQLD